MKKPALAIYALLITFTLLVGCAPLKHPNNFPNSRWICENPSGELIILEKEKRKAPNEDYNKLTMKINGEERIFAFPRLAGFDSGGSLRIWSDDPYHEYSREDIALGMRASMVNDNSKYIMKITDDPKGIFKGYTELVFERDLEYEKERGIE